TKDGRDFSAIALAVAEDSRDCETGAPEIFSATARSKKSSFGIGTRSKRASDTGPQSMRQLGGEKCWKPEFPRSASHETRGCVPCVLTRPAASFRSVLED